MSDTLTCKESFENIDEQLESIYQNGQISDWQLQSLLTCRDEGKVDFLLVDIREIYEYSELSIKGNDLLYPTSTLHLHIEKLEKVKDKFIILYCRRGNRTLQVLQALNRMEFKKVAHLSEGIITYTGEMLKNAELPN